MIKIFWNIILRIGSVFSRRFEAIWYILQGQGKPGTFWRAWFLRKKTF